MEARLKTATCSRCKTRKIRCDGRDPCISCSTATTPCHYEPDAKQSRFGFELRKGQACLACVKRSDATVNTRVAHVRPAEGRFSANIRRVLSSRTLCSPIHRRIPLK
ncbi:hypothetical protein B0H16DRAFT_851146 [Mycena metata]|uniref:Zn(2)-C6 fungal-type domain-containing protein n=1 Tax=Mycena metata TaxID=1033252 RepID=A0AAD7IL00_9AGAR|nr:hypothetical protein B0H16DRAFT_986986 [Mycena metata]KAJ7750520.1 hypothetical protein B0H16DRAFT_851146 [Mycena metata]